jgi:Fic family protein
VLALRRARGAVPADAPFSRDAIRAWHEALAGPVGPRRGVRERACSPAPAPELVEGRLATLAEWLEVAGPRDLAPDQVAAVALARLVEILPFDDANGRVSRLAASHLMVRGGMHPPILVAGDAPRLRAALESAFRLETEPLVALLAEASGRALDVMLQTLSGRASATGST